MTGQEARDEQGPIDVNVEWVWSDGRPNPTEVYIDSTMSQHMGDVFLRLKQGEDARGIFLTAKEWDAIDRAARQAIRHRAELTEAGWT